MATVTGLRIQGPQHEGFIFEPQQNDHFSVCTTVEETLMADCFGGETKGEAFFGQSSRCSHYVFFELLTRSQSSPPPPPFAPVQSRG